MLITHGTYDNRVALIGAGESAKSFVSLHATVLFDVYTSDGFGTLAKKKILPLDEFPIKGYTKVVIASQFISEIVEALLDKGVDINTLFWFDFLQKKIAPVSEMFFRRSKNYSTLYAVYDLEVFPPNYEIAVFLARVEVERISLGLDNITLIIVAGTFGGVSARGILSHGFESAQWRVAHIINAIGRLMPSCKGVHHICDRNMLAKLCEEKISYPADLTERPSPEHFYLGPLVHAYHSGVEVRPFRASRAAKIHTKSFIDNFLNGAPFITISLRENDYQHTRNSNFDMYQKICYEVSKLGLSVVVIRDTDAAFSSPVNWHKSIECPVASFDLDIRMAFYEQALLNLSVSSGPSWGLMLLSPKINFFLTNILDTNYRSTSEEFLKNAQGIRKGDQYPFSNEFQRLCWKDDSEDIALEFMELLLRRLKVC